MLAVGLCAALAGGRALLAWPAAFVAAMLAGGLIGAGGAPLPVVEPAIQASVVVIGAVAALALRVPMPVALAGLAVFGLAHGHAHGVEGPGGAAYAAGFLIATVALHAAGIALALLAARTGRSTLARGAGGAAALAGLALAFG
jgi:urease accessory protein